MNLIYKLRQKAIVQLHHLLTKELKQEINQCLNRIILNNLDIYKFQNFIRAMIPQILYLVF